MHVVARLLSCGTFLSTLHKHVKSMHMAFSCCQPLQLVLISAMGHSFIGQRSAAVTRLTEQVAIVELGAQRAALYSSDIFT
jgi:hypothetical protein